LDAGEFDGDLSHAVVFCEWDARRVLDNVQIKSDSKNQVQQSVYKSERKELTDFYVRYTMVPNDLLRKLPTILNVPNLGCVFQRRDESPLPDLPRHDEASLGRPGQAPLRAGDS
jgi:hypothetical protein